MTRFKTPLAATLVLALSATAGLAQEHTTFDARGDLSKGDDLDYDTVGSAVDEWGVFDAWDADQDEMMTRDEFNRGLYSTYDLDNNQMLDPDEYADLRRDGVFRRDWGAQ